MSFQIVVMTD